MCGLLHHCQEVSRTKNIQQALTHPCLTWVQGEVHVSPFPWFKSPGPNICGFGEGPGPGKVQPSRQRCPFPRLDWQDSTSSCHQVDFFGTGAAAILLPHLQWKWVGRLLPFASHSLAVCMFCASSYFGVFAWGWKVCHHAPASLFTWAVQLHLCCLRCFLRSLPRPVASPGCQARYVCIGNILVSWHRATFILRDTL